MKTVAVFATLVLLLASAQATDVFKWTDSQGVVHYGDRPPLTNAGNAASAATLSVPDNALSDDEKRAAQQRLDDARDKISAPSYSSSNYAGRARGAAAVPVPAAANSCAAAWRAYDATAACFSRHRVSEGKGVDAVGLAYCTNVPQPTCAR
ncbi:MAG: DUF4124 domain-containing protein [Betaproteobacteria bacterium]